MKKLILLLLLLIAGGAVGGGLYIHRELQTPYPNSQTPVLLEFTHGQRVRDVVGLIKERNGIRDQYAALAYILYSGKRDKLQAGEYLFDRPMTPAEVIDKIASGNVYLHKITIPEGLNIGEIAAKWQEEGFGTAAS